MCVCVTKKTENKKKSLKKKLRHTSILTANKNKNIGAPSSHEAGEEQKEGDSEELKAENTQKHVKKQEAVSHVKSKVGCMKGFLATPHIKTWSLTIPLWVFIILQMICQINFYSYCRCAYYYIECDTFWDYKCEAPCHFCVTNFISWLIFFITIYILYWCEVCKSSTLKYVENNVSDICQLHEVLDELRTAQPVISWWYVCIWLCVCVCVCVCLFVCFFVSFCIFLLVFALCLL